ncbi:MAG: hypothetical protein IJ583_00615 [Firmicutes bacterium]|nr:hypothetical protein [Bacillota bacterium]
MDNKMIFIMLFLLVLSAVAIFFIMRSLTKRSHTHSSKNKIREPGFIKLSTYLKWYSIINSNPILRQSLAKIHNGIAELSVFADVDIRRLSVQLWFLSNFMFLGIIIVLALMFRNIIIILLCVIFANILKDSLIDKKLTAMHSKLLFEESEMLSSLRQEYIRLRSIPDALASCECGKLIKKPIDEIYTVLTSPNVQDNLNEFYESCPLKTLQTLAGVCYAVDNTGDTTLADGSSNFVTALGMIADEVKLEIRGIALKRSKFKSLEFLPIVPIAALPALRWFFVNKIPGTRAIYDGQLGFIFVIIILILSMTAYKVILAATAAVAIKYDDRSAFDKRLMKSKRVRRFVAMIRPNSGKSFERVIKLLKTSMSRLNIDYVYLRKAYFCIGTFVASLVVIISSLIIGYFNVWNNVDNAGLISGNDLTPEEIAILKEMDRKYFSMPPMSDEDLAEFVGENYPNIKSNRIQDQVDRIREKEKALSELYFKWEYLLLCMVLSFIAWRIPEMILKFRTMLIKAESEEDCLQLQTVIAIMMNTSIDTLDLLDWLGKHSRVFRPILIDAYHAYPADDYRALRELKYKAGLPDFKRLIDKLMLTVSQISIAEAFSDLIIEREHLLRMREMSQEESILKKRQIMSIVATAPRGAAICLYFVAPIAIIGIKELGGLLGGSGLI